MASHVKVFFLGDSHVSAVVRAIDAGDIDDLPFTPIARRRFKRNSDSRLGTPLDNMLGILNEAGQDDVLVSMSGGNKFHAIGMMKHPVPFDFFECKTLVEPDEADTIIPYAVIEKSFDNFMRITDKTLVVQARKRFRGTIFHAVAPPPKEDNEYILTNADTGFREAGIDEVSVSGPLLRLKLWRAQHRALERQYSKIGVQVLPPPARSVNAAGYLVPEAYGNATHANAFYGRLVLEQITEVLHDRVALEPA